MFMITCVWAIPVITKALEITLGEEKLVDSQAEVQVCLSHIHSELRKYLFPFSNFTNE